MSVTAICISLACLSISAEAIKQSECRSPAASWHYLTSQQVKKVKIAILPVGSIESHGPHLPLGTDVLIAESLVRHATDGLSDIAVLPATSYGASFEHASQPGTIPLQDETLHGLWKEIMDGIISAGVKKILIVNGHGGQTPNAQIAVRSIRFRSNTLAVLFDVQASLGEAYARSQVLHDDNVKQREQQYGIHGGLVETAVMFYLFPSLVDRDQLIDFKPIWASRTSLHPYGQIVSYGWKSEDLCDHGAVGNAGAADAQLGKQIFHSTAAALRDAVIKVLDTEVEEILNLHTT